MSVSGKGGVAVTVGGVGAGPGGAATPTVNAAAAAKVAAEREISKGTDRTRGLTNAEVDARRAKYGFNELPETQVNPCIAFLSYFWGPVPGMIWVAIVVEAINAAWEDFSVLIVLQLANGLVGWYEERNAGNAVAALKNSLGSTAFVCRESRWSHIPARELVPGDLVDLTIGQAVPADAVLVGPDDVHMLVDQSALTGESLPVDAYQDFKLMMGSIVRSGEGHAVVVGTGEGTFFGKAAALISSVQEHGRFQHVVFSVTVTMLATSVVLCSIILAVLLFAHTAFLRTLSIVIVLLVASIPMAMQVVTTSTMAAGSRMLAHKKVIVARLGAIEELAGMDVLCSDKTGTLTTNKLLLRPPTPFSGRTPEDMTFLAALACKRTEGNQDAVDTCITEALTPTQRARLATFAEMAFVPFNPNDKRTQSTVRSPHGRTIQISKGAPQVILQLCGLGTEDDAAKRVEVAIQELADRGFRGIGLASRGGDAAFATGGDADRRASAPPAGKDADIGDIAVDATVEDAADESGDDDEGPGAPWVFEGLLSLYDPPRHDTKETIDAAGRMGIEVKMITGDHTAIAKETCRELGMGANVLRAHLLDATSPQAALDELIMHAHGFAEVMPEHKFLVVDRIRLNGHVTGMTGDGVNDAPALKRANIGIAVQGATDAAKAAADIVLTEPGLSVIVDAIVTARQIFQRIRSYMIYRIAVTMQLLFFFFIVIIAINPQTIMHDSTVPPAFTLPVTALVITTVLNDGCMITIAKDNAVPRNEPQSWDLGPIYVLSSVLGLTATLSSVVLLVALLRMGPGASGTSWFAEAFAPASQCFASPDGEDCFLTYGQIQTAMWLKISVHDFLTVASARAHGFFFTSRPGAMLFGAAMVAVTSSSIIAAFAQLGEASDSHGQTEPIHGTTILAVWVYTVLCFFVQDACKVGARMLMDSFKSAPRRGEERVSTRQAHALQSNEHATDHREAVAAGEVREGSRMAHVASMRSMTAPKDGMRKRSSAALSLGDAGRSLAKITEDTSVTGDIITDMERMLRRGYVTKAEFLVLQARVAAAEAALASLRVRSGDSTVADGSGESKKAD